MVRLTDTPTNVAGLTFTNFLLDTLAFHNLVLKRTVCPGKLGSTPMLAVR